MRLCHREERSDVAIHKKDRHVAALLAMTAFIRFSQPM